MNHQTQPIGVGGTNRQGYTVRKEVVAADGMVAKRVLERPDGGNPYTAQRKINAFNFPFTGNPGAGCEFKCVYCYLQVPFFQRHVTLPHGREVNALPDFAAATAKFLKSKAHLPQYMKRIQWGVSTEMWLPSTVGIWKPQETLEAYRDHGSGWMLHMVTKCPEILKYKSLLAEMKDRVQVEVSFVTLDEEASRVFETGTPSVSQRLRIVEELAEAGVFVRMMMMPCMRQYELAMVGAERHMVFQHLASGQKAPGFKKVTEKDGNAEGKAVGIKIHRNGRWRQLALEESKDWKPVVVRDWSKLAETQALWPQTGARAYKQKDLNYYFVDELLDAHAQKRPSRRERGRVEDPTAECLVHSGESVRDEHGNPRTVEVEAWHLPKKEWGGPTPPKIHRHMMDYGYSLHSPIDWIDCR